MSENSNTITIDEKEYNFDELTEEQKGLVNIYRTWSTDLNDLRLEIAKEIGRASCRERV